MSTKRPTVNAYALLRTALLGANTRLAGLLAKAPKEWAASPEGNLIRGIADDLESALDCLTRAERMLARPAKKKTPKMFRGGTPQVPTMNTNKNRTSLLKVRRSPMKTSPKESRYDDET